MKNAAGVAAICVGSLAYLELLRNWFFKPHPSILIEHDATKREANIKFVTLTSTPCVTQTTKHHGVQCLQEKHELLPVTSHAVAGEPIFRAINVGSLREFEEACDACQVYTEISYKNEYGRAVNKKVPWTHSMNRHMNRPA